MSEHLTRAETLERLNDWADQLVIVTVEVFWIHEDVEAQFIWLAGQLEHFEDDHPNYRRGSFVVGHNYLQLGDLLGYDAPSHAFNRPPHALSDGGVVLYVGASMRIAIRAPAPGLLLLDE